MSKKKKGKAGGKHPWAEAKRLCRLNARQVEMAKRLGLNPKKLPGLRPSPSQQWKAPVPVFIEDLYRKKFGDDDPLLDAHPARGHVSDESSSLADRGVDFEIHGFVPRAEAKAQAEAALVHLANLEQVVSCALQRSAASEDFLEDLTTDLKLLVEDLRSGQSPCHGPYVAFDVDDVEEEEEPPLPPDDGEIPF